MSAHCGLSSRVFCELRHCQTTQQTPLLKLQNINLKAVQTTPPPIIIFILLISLLLLDLLVYKCPDDSQCVQHQAIHILLLPSWLVGPSASAWRPDRVPGSTAPSLSGVCTYACTVIHPPSLPSGCPRRPMVMVLQVTILPAHTAVTHGSSAGDHTGKGLPEWRKGV